MRTGWIAGAILLAWATGAGAQGTALDPAARDAAKLYYDCLHRAAEQLDDRRSDAASVAVGVAAACRPQERNVAVASSKGNFQLQQSMQQTLTERSVGTATKLVLAVRAYRSKGPTGKPKAKKGDAI